MQQGFIDEDIKLPLPLTPKDSISLLLREVVDGAETLVFSLPYDSITPVDSVNTLIQN